MSDVNIPKDKKWLSWDELEKQQNLEYVRHEEEWLAIARKNKCNPLCGIYENDCACRVAVFCAREKE